MYKAVIEAHNLKEIETEPNHLATLKDEQIYVLLTEIKTVVAAADRKKLFDGYSLTVTITKEKK